MQKVRKPFSFEEIAFVQNAYCGFLPDCVYARVPEAFRFSLVARQDPQIVQSGERTNPAGKPVSNKILLSITDNEYNTVRPHLEYVRLPNHLVLHEAGVRLEFAYFLNRGLISLVVVMKDGKTAEAGVVGNESFTGTPAVVGLSRGPLRAVVQITGDGFRVKVGALQDTLESTPPLAHDVEPLCRNPGYAGCSDSRVQSAARYWAAPGAVVVTGSG
jgi:CRP-like cAMP-binding protein